MGSAQRPLDEATLGSVAAADGDPITVWCNNPACGYAVEHGTPYRAVLTPADVSTIVDSDHETPQERWEREAAEAREATGQEKWLPRPVAGLRRVEKRLVWGRRLELSQR